MYTTICKVHSYMQLMSPPSVHDHMQCACLCVVYMSHAVYMYPSSVHVSMQCACIHAVCMYTCSVHVSMQCACIHAVCMSPCNGIVLKMVKMVSFFEKVLINGGWNPPCRWLLTGAVHVSM
jgi:hypothetical protein